MRRGVSCLAAGSAYVRVLTFSVLAMAVAVLAIASMAIAQDSITINGDDDLTAANGVTGGSGTKSDPYIIEGLNITGTESYCIYINYTESHVVIQGMNLSSWNRTYTGIYLDHVANVTIRDMTFFNMSTDLEARWCTDITVENVSTLRGRLQFSWSHGIRVDNYHFRRFYTGSQATITVYESTNASITNCSFWGSETAIRLSDADHVRVFDNDMRDLRYGITTETQLLNFNDDVIIEGNTIMNFSSSALSLIYVNGLGLANNTITGEGYTYDVHVYGRNLWYIRDNTMETGGIRLGYRFPEEGVWDFRNYLLAGREIYYYSNEIGLAIPLDTHQVILFNCSDCTITGPYLMPYRPFFTVLACSNITVSKFSFVGENYDLIASLNDNLTIEDCDFTDYRYALWITDSTDVAIRRCDFKQCGSGIILDDCRRAVVEDCVFIGCVAGIGEGLHSIYRPGDSIVIENNTFRDSWFGITFERLSHSSIVGNVFDNMTRYGIFIEYPGSYYSNTNVTIAENTFFDCVTGMELRGMKHCSVRRNVIEGSNVGVRIFYSESGTISWNRISNSSSVAIDITSMTEDFVVKANVLENSYRYGLMIDWTGCRIFLNDYNTSRQAYDRLGNQWDDQRLGNYWDDYEEWYPDATNDGTVWSYDVSMRGSYFDNFPLVQPFDLEPPVADAGGNQTVDEGDHVTLDGTGSRDNRGIVRYEWTFVYEQRLRELNGPTVGFTFTPPGVYRVDLVVFDAMENEGSCTIWVTVRDTQPPSVDVGTEVLAEQFTMVTLDGSGCHDSGGIANYTWTIDWVDGPLVLYGKFPLVYCSHAGTFNVHLRVTDHAGHWAEDTTTLVVMDREKPVTVIETPYEVDQGVNLYLDASNSTDNVGITRYEWTIRHDGGKETLEGSHAVYAWTVPGNYSCTLVLRDKAGNGNSTRFLVTVLDTERPRIEDPGDLGTDMGVPFRFPALRITDNVEVIGITWTFVYEGETVVLEGTRPTYTFQLPGAYEVALAAQDARGNEAVVRFNVTAVDPDAPVARAGQDRVVSVGTTVTLAGGMSVDNDGIVKYTWTFRHDGTDHYLEGETVTFRFIQVGAHEVTLTVWDPSGNNATDTVVITVVDTKPPVAKITAPATVRAGTEVIFHGTGSEDNVGVVNWTWTFEHNGTDVERYGVEATFVFEVPGTYTITLTVRDGMDLEGKATVDIWVTERDVDDGNGDPDENAIDYVPIVVAVLLIVVPLVVITVVLLLRRQQGPGQGPDDGGGEGNGGGDTDGWVEYQ